MVTIIIFAFIFFVGCVILTWDLFTDGFILAIAATLLACCLGLAGGILGWGISLGIPAHLKTEVTTYEIVSLQDNQSVQGQFFLGSGVVDGTMKYSFYYEYGNGYKLAQLNPNNTTIIYDKNEPKCIEYKQVKNDDFINYFSCSMHEGDKEYEIYVPKGTIKNNFNLDAQ